MRHLFVLSTGRDCPSFAVLVRGKHKSQVANQLILRILAITALALLITTALATGKASAGYFCPIGSGSITLYNPGGSTEPWSCTRFQSGPLSYTSVTYYGSGSPYDGGCAGSRTGEGDFRHIDGSVIAYNCGGSTSATCGGGCGTGVNAHYYPFIKNSGGNYTSSGYAGNYS